MRRAPATAASGGRAEPEATLGSAAAEGWAEEEDPGLRGTPEPIRELCAARWCSSRATPAAGSP